MNTYLLLQVTFSSEVQSKRQLVKSDAFGQYEAIYFPESSLKSLFVIYHILQTSSHECNFLRLLRAQTHHPPLDLL